MLLRPRLLQVHYADVTCVSDVFLQNHLRKWKMSTCMRAYAKINTNKRPTHQPTLATCRLRLSCLWPKLLIGPSKWARGACLLPHSNKYFTLSIFNLEIRALWGRSFIIHDSKQHVCLHEWNHNIHRTHTHTQVHVIEAHATSMFSYSNWGDSAGTSWSLVWNGLMGNNHEKAKSRISTSFQFHPRTRPGKRYISEHHETWPFPSVTLNPPTITH